MSIPPKNITILHVLNIKIKHTHTYNNSKTVPWELS